MLMPDETKTSLVAAELADGETVVLVEVDRADGKFRVWVTTDMDQATLDEGSVVAVCEHDWQARAVALAISGAVDCDLDLGLAEAPTTGHNQGANDAG